MFYGTHGSIKDLEEHVMAAVKKLAPHADKFDSIAVRGISGLVVGAPVAMTLRKPLMVVRKDAESSHSANLVETLGKMGTRVLFLDDFTSSGKTRRAVREAVIEFRSSADLVGEYLYQNWEDDVYGDDCGVIQAGTKGRLEVYESGYWD